MNTVLNNLISLLDEGAFGKTHEVLPISAFKWKVLYKLAVAEDVAPYISKAIPAHENDRCLNMPDDIRLLFRQATFNGKDGLSQGFDIDDIDSVNLSYVVKRYVLKDLVYKERHSIDTSKVSLDLLALILQNSGIILQHGIRLRGIVEIGIFLRSKGQYVDFVKLENWIQRLKLNKMARLQASVLTDVFSLDADEFPYIKKTDKHARKLAERSMKRAYRANKLKRQTGKYSIANCIRFYRYSHSESICKAMSNISKSLSEIEE